MARNKTTWPKGQKSPTHRPKGAKNKRTVLLEAIGLTGWENLQQYIEKEGTEKLIAELQKLKGKDFVQAMGSILDYFKPKQKRKTLTVNHRQDLEGAPINFE